ncbi:MAG: hypothetical protein PVG20_09750 [Thioalkalispiraceae bacterium]|jgi:hypothetical protein
MKKLIALVLFLVSTNLWSAMIIETIQLQHRPTDEVIPIIQPMLAPDAKITGTGYKLIIKSTPENLSQIKSLLKEIDVNQNLLRIYVSLGRPINGTQSSGRQSSRTETHASVSAKAENDSATVTIGTPNSKPESEISLADKQNKLDARIYQTEQNTDKPGVQVMSVSEGYWANISTGQAIPITTRTRNSDGTVTETITYQQIMSGYQVRPQIHGNQVTLTIRPYQQSSAKNNATFDTTEMQTTLTGNLGKWLFIGSTNQEENLNNSGITYQTQIRSTDVNEVWVKVERP